MRNTSMRRAVVNPDKWLRFNANLVFDSESQGDVCIKIPEEFRQLVMQVMYRFLWDIYLDNEGEKIQLEEWQKDIVQRGMAMVQFPVLCDNIIESPPEIEYIEVLRMIKENSEMCCCCGCGKGEHPPEWDEPVGDDEGEVGLPPEPDDTMPEDENERATICAIANQIADGIIDTATRMSNTLTFGTTTVASIQSVLAAILKLRGWKLVLAPALFFSLMVSLAITLLVTSAFSTVVEVAGIYRDRFVCAIYVASSPANGKSNYMAVVRDIRVRYGYRVSMWFYLIGILINWNKIYDQSQLEDGDIWAEYIDADCSSCGSPPITPTEPPTEPGNEPIPIEVDSITYYLVPFV